MMERIADGLPRHRATFVIAYYLLTILTGGVVFLAHGQLGLVFDLIACACYIAVTALFYELSR